MSLTEFELEVRESTTPKICEFEICLTKSLEIMLGSGKTWDKHLQDTLSNALVEERISSQAYEYLMSRNQLTESGRHGFIGVAFFVINEGMWPNENILKPIMEDCSWNLFSLRVIDDFVDQPEFDDETRIRRLSSFNLSGKVFGEGEAKRYCSPAEEAASFVAGYCSERFKKNEKYLSTISSLYLAAKEMETIPLNVDTLIEVKKKDKNISFLTILPTVDILRAYGVNPSRSTIMVMESLAAASRTWDHLGDMEKDRVTGARNYVLYDVLNTCFQEAERDKRIREYIRETYTEIKNGDKLLTGLSRDMYRVFSLLAISTYWLDYKIFANSKSKFLTSLRNPLGRVIRSYKRND